MKAALLNFAQTILPERIFNVVIGWFKIITQKYQKFAIPEFIETRYGFQIKAMPGDINMRATFYKTWQWESHVTDIIQKNVNNGDICLDIGANVWFDTMVFSKLIGDTWRVYGFEPSPKIFSILQDNITHNNMQDNVILMHQWLGSKTETVKLFMDSFNPGWSTICHNYWWTHEEIKITTLDELAIDTVDFIKMDIEGYEYEALLGMTKTLDRNKDIKIVFEWSPQYYNNITENWKEYSIHILDFLVSKWFTLYELDPIVIWNKVLITDFTALYEKIGTNFGSHTDIFAVRE